MALLEIMEVFFIVWFCDSQIIRCKFLNLGVGAYHRRLLVGSLGVCFFFVTILGFC